MPIPTTPAPATAPCWRHRETLDLMRLRYGENFAGAAQAVRYGEALRLDGVDVSLSSGRPCAGLGADHGRGRRSAGWSHRATTSDVADPTCAAFEPLACDVFITEATFGLPVFRHGNPDGEIAKLLRSVALFPERAHLVGAYALGKAQRVIALLRAAGYDRPIYLHGAHGGDHPLLCGEGIDLGELRPVREAAKAAFAGAIVICPPAALQRPLVAPLSRSGHAPSPRDGCGSGPARASAVSNCRWSFPITPIGTG